MLVSQKYIQKISALGVTVSLLLPSFVSAQSLLPKCDPLITTGAPRAAYADASGAAHFCGIADLFGILINVYNFLLGLAGLVLLLMLIWGGMKMLFFYLFEDASGTLEGAKKTITRAITGFIIIIAAFLLVNTTLFLLGFSSTSSLGRILQPYFNFQAPPP